MTQCHVYRNPSRQTRARVPYLLDVQADLLNALATRVVAPLVRLKFLQTPLSRLHPRFEIEGQTLVMATAELAAVPAKLLAETVADLSAKRATIVAAVDCLLAGV